METKRTPRTDALSRDYTALPKFNEEWLFWTVQYADLSRQLELENVELRSACESFIGWISTSLGTSSESHQLKLVHDKIRAALAKLERTK